MNRLSALKSAGVFAAAACLVVGAAALYVRFGLISPKLARVEERLNDPASAQFRNLKYVGSWLPSGESILCGEVNAKNRMGGYVGFRKFETLADYVEIRDAESEQALSGALRGTFCDKADEVMPWWSARW